MKTNECEHARPLRWSDVVYECMKKDKCKLELKLPGSKYCMWKEKEKLEDLK